MPEDVQGTHDPRFAELREVFAEHLAGDEVGAAIAVDVDGETVVDLWGGHADAARTRPWQADTLVNVWSSTKSVTSLAALVLVERGLLDVFAPVADYWPEFAAGGKEHIEVRHLMAHTSGVAGWERPFALEDMFDWAHATGRLAAQKPWWEPGTASGYHAAAQGHLVGEVVRRVTGVPLKQFVREEIAGPLGADFQIGALPQDAGRVAEIIPPPPLPVDLGSLDPDLPVVKTFTGPVLDAARANDADWRAADLGALNGHASARGLARILSPIARGGTANGVALLSPATIDLIFQEQARGVDLVLGVPLRWGIGFGLPEPATLPYLPDERIAFWGGWGGSMIITDPARRLTIAYVMNRMAPGIIGSDRSAAYLTAIYQALT
ncbi:serine hydrolase domain-containing protein [Actinocorallia sp. A-T 12471]|uniref:serine hydrolase domain-containing protein n=1 Tax=Actinocorallia sp. A-T 12471 TaxID=3089813 RepID=UPI0029CC0F4E|nr:serine hydrolase domain-containing protein [Actinocorallia sp. A-T 12471]MDX6743987.1 serine hydrolase domain-containing protein [Actinocorallia sp. A-T 12471]